MAKQRTGRQVHGLLLLNKPVGLSSNAALQRAKHLFQARKAGHTGSLDKLASGLLPVCLGEATKLSSFLLDADKHYQAECTLGVTTTTGDSEGEVLLTRPINDLDDNKINAVVQSFIGSISQIPPMYSALKRQGQPLYKLARQGQTVERQARTIKIYNITVQNWAENRLFIKVHCSKGTYIRTLVEDLGEALGCGAYVSALHRTGVGEYADMFDFETLEHHAQQGIETLDSLLIPLHTVLSHWPEIQLSSELTHYVRQGQAIQVSSAPTKGWVKLFTHHTDTAHFIGIGQILEDGRIAPKRLINL